MQTIRRSAALLAALCGVACGVSLRWTPALPKPFQGIGSGDVPQRLGKWRSDGDYQLPSEVGAALSSADTVTRHYSDGDATHNPINFVLIGGTDRNALHDPRSCLIGGGWRLENDHAETLAPAKITVRSCQAIRESADGNKEAFDIIYWYVVDGNVRSGATEIRMEMLASALLGRKNRPVYFFRLMAPLESDPTTRTEDHTRLGTLGAEAWKTVAPRIAPQ